jgi:hypothetical protein
MTRADIPEKGCRKPRMLWFLVRYDWETRATKVCRTNASAAYKMYENLGPDESLHRCEVVLTPTLGSGNEMPPPELIGREAYNESDLLHPDGVTPWQIMRRINMCRVMPILPLDGYALGAHTLERDGRVASEELTILRGQERKPYRKFRVTVEELPTDEKILKDLDGKVDGTAS